MSTNIFDLLDARELLFLQKHLKLGKGHLQDCLTESEVEKLLHLGRINPKTKKTLQADKQELIGSAANIFNSALVSLVGAWGGISGFLNLGISSGPFFIVGTTLAVVLGCTIGFTGFKYNKRKARQAIEKRELQSVELAISQALIKKREKELEILLKKINKNLKSIDLLPFDISPDLQSLDLQMLGTNWLTLWTEKIKNSLYRKDPALGDWVLNYIEEVKDAYSEGPLDNVEKKELFIIVQKLATMSIQPPDNLRTWTKSNWRFLLLQSVPVICGTCSSIFTYLRKIPELAETLGSETLSSLSFSWWNYKPLQLTALISITAYLVYSFFRSNRRAFQRDKALVEAEAHILREEKKASLLADDLIKIQHLHVMMERVIPLINMGEKMQSATT